MKQGSLGIDVGSTSIKGVLYDVEAKRVLHVERHVASFRVASTPPAHYEEDPRAILQAAQQVISNLSSFAVLNGIQIAAIAFTGQMHGGLVVDEDMEPLTNFISWQDKRGDEILPEKGASYSEKLRELRSDADATGVGIHTGFLLTTLFWLSKNNALPSGKVVGIYDWLTSRLVGRPTTDYSSAAAWAMFDIVKTSWNHALLGSAGLPHTMLPEIAEPGTDLGLIIPERAEELGLPKTLRVKSSIGDTQASYLGSGCRPSEILLNFGTGSQSMWESTKPIAGYATDVRYLLDGRYLVTAPTLAGGKAYQVLAEFYSAVITEFTGKTLARESVYERMNKQALAGKSGLHVDPVFAGSRFREMDVRGSISAITSDNFRPEFLTRALLEGMVEEIAAPYYAWQSEMLRNGQEAHRAIGLVGSGNGMRRNEALQEIACARFKLPLRVSPFDEEAALGAALLASWSEGEKGE